jgi:hypothetical protein
MTMNNAALGKIIRSHFNSYLITYKYTNSILTHTARCMSNDHMIILKFNFESSIRQKLLAPRAGFEPATNRLTAGCSTTELPGNPLMGGNFIPHEFWLHENMTTILHDPSSVQFSHRSLAYVVTILCIILAIKVNKQSKTMALLIITTIATQVTLGILTLIYVVPIKIALLHQICAIALLSVIHFSASNKFLKNHLPSK